MCGCVACVFCEMKCKEKCIGERAVLHLPFFRLPGCGCSWECSGCPWRERVSEPDLSDLSDAEEREKP
jgi:hypothetical protein